jgi:hypothetical protein
MNPNPLTDHMSWWQMKICLNNTDIQQYRDFVLQCPTIQERITLNTVRNGFKFGNISFNDNNQISTRTLKPVSELEDIMGAHYPPVQEKQPSYTCSESPDTLTHLLTHVISAWNMYITTNSNDDYSKMCYEWLDRGLTPTIHPTKLY